MKSPRFMLIAGETSGDVLAAELVEALKASPALSTLETPLEFLGAGGPRMEAAGVQLAINLTEHALFGISDVLSQYFKFRRMFKQLFRLALDRQPDVVILVDYSGFNRRFAHAIKQYVRARQGAFYNWDPKVVYYVSPQVWASRESRAYQLARDVDLLLSIFPFEKAWYEARVPQLRVEFVGHPLIDRYANVMPAVPRTESGESSATFVSPPGLAVSHDASAASRAAGDARRQPVPLVLLLPGSRKREVAAHLPLMLRALAQIESQQSLRARTILPNADLADQARPITASRPEVEIQTGGLAQALAEADLVMASSGTVTMECAYFRVPTVVLYKTSWPTYWIARQIVRVKYIAMPNILAGELVYPEFIQNQATCENVAREGHDLLTNAARRSLLKEKLARVIETLGAPGASVRAANQILRLVVSRIHSVE